MKGNKTLMLFTGEFPYGRVGEPFLNEEIFYLANYFEKIIVFPRGCSISDIRELPENVLVDNVLCLDSSIIKKYKFKILPKASLILIGQSLKSRKNLKYLLYFRHFLYLITEALIIKALLKKKHELTLKSENTLLYSYWFDNSLLALCMLKKRGIVKKIVSRIHGFDLYDNRNIGGVVPFREFKTKYCDVIFAISKNGEEYFIERISKKYHKKVHLSYLGVKRRESLNKNLAKNEIPVVVSCARVEQFKRIEMIAEALKQINRPIKWIHFGDGPNLENVKSIAKELPDNINAEFRGHVTNKEVLDFYNNNSVDLFISASKSEGLPVTMMEAISFGIPIVSFNLGGISEIVNKTTGILVEDINDFDGFVNAIKKAIFEKYFDKNAIIKFYQSNFNAENNYKKFAQTISCLQEK